MKRTLVGYFDGACYPVNNNMHMGVGAIIFDTNNEGLIFNENNDVFQSPSEKWKPIFEYNSYHPFPSEYPVHTNNVAEYLGFINIISYIHEKARPDDTIYICGDSNMVISQMKDIWAIKDGAYKPYANHAKEFYKKLSDKNIKLVWIPRNLNQVADDLSKKTN